MKLHAQLSVVEVIACALILSSVSGVNVQQSAGNIVPPVDSMNPERLFKNSQDNGNSSFENTQKDTSQLKKIN